jgi:hypothetical protein
MSKFLLVIGVSLLNCGMPLAQKEAPRIHNIVLIHGAWADGSGWKGVHEILSKDGYNAFR